VDSGQDGEFLKIDELSFHREIVGPTEGDEPLNMRLVPLADQAHTYFAMRLLGHASRLYDRSWEQYSDTRS